MPTIDSPVFRSLYRLRMRFNREIDRGHHPSRTYLLIKKVTALLLR